MAKNPSDRFLSYDEFTADLWAARSHLLIRQSQQVETKGGKSKTSWWRR
jgi:hypothetical protein